MTDKQKTEYFKKVGQNIKKFGCHITTILEDKETTPFGYSTGLYSNFKIPELFISGLPPRLTHEIIEIYSIEYRKKKFKPLRIIKNLTNRFPVYFTTVPIRRLEEYILSSMWYYGSDHFDCLQLIYPDVNGFFPGEKNYNYDQEIFGRILRV